MNTVSCVLVQPALSALHVSLRVATADHIPTPEHIITLAQGYAVGVMVMHVHRHPGSWKDLIRA